MPSPSDQQLLDERYEELAAQLRAARPRASEQLREQVRELARRPVVERSTTRAPLFRRLAPLALAALLVAAVVGGVALLSSQTSTSTEGAGGGDEAASAPAMADARESQATTELNQSVRAAPGAATLPPAGGRAQEYRAELSVRVAGVEELSGMTTRARQITRSLGGYVVSARYDEPGDADGDSVLVVRVPVARVQAAIMRFSELGALLAQHISVADLQAQLDRQSDAIAALQRTIERLETQLADPDLDRETRDRLRFQLLEAKRNLAAREGGHAQTKRRAATARIALTLTTREEAQPVEPTPDEEGFATTLKDALNVLAAILTWTLAALIVASPLLVLVALLLAAYRMRRRAEERRLLERTAS